MSWIDNLLKFCLREILNNRMLDTSILVLIFNAAIDCPTMTPLFPDYLTRHYTYLRDILPDLVPSLKVSECFIFCFPVGR